MTRSASVLFILVFALSATGAPLPVPSAPKEPEAVLKLRKAQLAAAEDALKDNPFRVLREEPFDEVQAGGRVWSRRVLNARLALASNQAERVTACQSYAKEMRYQEELFKQKYEVGRATIANVKAVSYVRLEADLLLRNAEANLPPQPTPKTPETPLELRKAQLAAGEEVLKSHLAEYEGGKDVLDETIAWSRRVFASRQALAASPAQHVGACKWYVETMKGIEKSTKKKYDAGRGTFADYKAATYFRLEAEILLFKAEAR